MIESSASLSIHDTKDANTRYRNKRWIVSMGGYKGYITVARDEKKYIEFFYDEPTKGAPSFILI